MAMKVFCGEALCKAPVAVTPPSSGPWPVRCSACGTALYPADILARLVPSEFEPKRGELMTERRGLRVSVSSGDFSQPSGSTRAAPPTDRDIDQLLSMVKPDSTGIEGASGNLSQPSRSMVTAPPTNRDIDQLPAMVEPDLTSTKARRARRRKAALLGVVVLILVAIAVAALMTR